MKIGDSPRVVCLCGSTRFAEDMSRVARDYTLRHWIVVRPEVVAYSKEGDPQKTDRVTKARLDVLHFAKIDLADLVYVVNKDGYIGESTEREIEYALMRGKRVEYMWTAP